MKRFNRIARVEKLSELLRTRDAELRSYTSYETWIEILNQYAHHPGVTNFEKLLKATADLIDEALEGKED